jgi:hypothetical protein
MAVGKLTTRKYENQRGSTNSLDRLDSVTDPSLAMLPIVWGGCPLREVRATACRLPESPSLAAASKRHAI